MCFVWTHRGALARSLRLEQLLAGLLIDILHSTCHQCSFSVDSNRGNPLATNAS